MIWKLVVIALTIVLILAAASMTALFICPGRRPTPAAFLTAASAQPALAG